MFRLMIVEDEPIVLEGMLKIIDFNDLGYEVVSACSNGKEAFEQFDQANPDVVITDICMDIMDGLEFIEKVRDRNDHTKFIIVSGHQDFKFFKQAINLKVLDYILKPVTAKEFREILTKIAKEFNEEVVLDNSLDKVDIDSDDSKQVYKSVFLNELMNIKFSENEILNNLIKYKIEFSKKHFAVSLFKAGDLQKASRALNYSSSSLLLNYIYNQIQKHSARYKNTISFIDPQGYIVMIINNDSYDNIKKISFEVSRKLNIDFSKETKTLINAYLGYYVDSIIDISTSYKSTETMVVKGILKNRKNYYDANEILIKRKENGYDYAKPIEQWKRKIIYGDKSATDELDDILKNIKDAYFLFSDYKNMAQRMIEGLRNEIETARIENIDVNINFEIITEDELTNFLYKITLSVMDEIDKKTSNKETYIAKKAIEYIDANFSDIYLDLHSICEYLNISVSYFSQAFKKNTKRTFIKYLNNYRVEKAKYYLEFSQKSISEIGEMVGYVDPHYFGIVFKKYAEFTPKKYRNMKRK